MKIGLLFPLSNAHPGIGLDFMDGLNACLAQTQLTGNVVVVRENIGFGGNEKELYDKASKLLVGEDVDVLIAYVDEKVIPIIYPLLQATGKLMLLVNSGANYPSNWIAQPTVIGLNLQHAFACWLTGGLAARSGNGKAVFASTFYDCGYLHCAAIVNNFMDSGGTLLYNYINNQAYDDTFDINQLTDFIASNPETDNLLCIFDEFPASLFYGLLNDKITDKTLGLFVSPMMLEEKALAKRGEGFGFSLEGYLPWHAGIDNEANRHFIKSCKRPASMFSLLGWETAMLLHEISLNKELEPGNGEAVVDHLKSKTINGPRGILELDPETQYYLAPLGRYSLPAGNTVAETIWITNLQNEWKAFTAKSTEGVVSGWTNTYLCY